MSPTSGTHGTKSIWNDPKRARYRRPAVDAYPGEFPSGTTNLHGAVQLTPDGAIHAYYPWVGGWNTFCGRKLAHYRGVTKERNVSPIPFTCNQCKRFTGRDTVPAWPVDVLNEAEGTV